MKLVLRSIFLVFSLALLAATVVLVVTDRGLNSMVTALSAVITFLAAFSDLKSDKPGESDKPGPRFRFAFRRIYEDLLRHILGFRYRRRPPLQEYERVTAWGQT